MTIGPGTAPVREMSASQRSAAAIAGALSAAGTRLLFGMPGGGPNLDVIGAAEASGMPFILTHGESAATMMAATYADLTGAPGAAVVTRGPGLASAVNGIAHAALDRLPLVVIADTVPAQDRDRISHQLLDQAALGRSVAKAVVTIGAAQASQAAGQAVRIALAHPAGPVVVNVDAGARGLLPQDADLGNSVRSHDLAPLAAALQAARRLVIILGSLALPHTDRVRAALVGSGIPVLHTYRARGVVPDSAAEAAGLFTGGTMESPLLSGADLIVGLGVDPVELIPATWAYAAPAILVTDVPAGSAGYFTGGTELATSLPAAIEVLARHRARHSWPPEAGRAAKTDVTRRLCRAAAAAPGYLQRAGDHGVRAARCDRRGPVYSRRASRRLHR